MLFLANYNFKKYIQISFKINKFFNLRKYTFNKKIFFIIMIYCF